jgi:DNA-binding HxlR family transcriptional regulator
MTTTKGSSKSYKQYCPVARTLDVVGERWTLLIVRDLLLGPKRYTDLRAALPGIATDILTARLRTLEDAGFVRRRELPRPAPATVYELTEDGLELRHAILALGHVGMTNFGPPRRGEDIRGERLMTGLRVSFRRERFSDLTETYEITIDDEPFTIEVRDGGVEIRPGAATDPAIKLRTDAGTFVAMLTGGLSATDAVAGDRAALEGERRALARFIEAFAFGPDPGD